MTLYGPLTAQDYLRLMRSLANQPPDRSFFEQVLDGLIYAVEAERGFLLEEGDYRVLAARNCDQQSIRRPQECISYFAVQRTINSLDGVHHRNVCQVDRRYRTESIHDGRKQARSVLGLRFNGGVAYFDHRFQNLSFTEHERTAVDHWLALVELAFQIRELRRHVSKLENAERPTPAFSPPPVEPEPPPSPVAPVVFHGLWTCSAKLIELFETVKRLALSDIPVVIYGETGTGKGLLAKAIHGSSSRSQEPFVSVDCGSIPDGLIESELFGHVRGAFTGADADREGMLVHAEGGTLFLDDIADMSSLMQKKLLRFLEDGRFRPLGGGSEIQANVRILSATRLDLTADVEGLGFRSDLYYRLCGVRLKAPSLRDHREDIAGLAVRFINDRSRDLCVEPPTLSDSAVKCLLRYSWPGNVRELENTMRQIVSDGHSRITEEHLSSILWGPASSVALGLAATIEEAVESAEREAIADALGQSAGNKSRAAELLGITRKALYRRLGKYGLLEKDTEGDEES